MTTYETVVGLEIHVELSTESKLFCSCPTAFGGRPNSHTCPVCTGMPGTLPVLNRRALELAVAVGLALHCHIAEVSVFDRKNYFYPDNPQNYQISQLYHPICQEGYLDVPLDGEVKRFCLQEIHLEEDAGKLIHDESSGRTLIDYNRAGVPLIEIVTKPVFGSGREVVAFLEELKGIIGYIGASDCRIQEGSMRVDVNLSVRPLGGRELGTRTEMKNLASFHAICAAIQEESRRQTELLAQGETIRMETRRWDEGKNCSYPMRSKEEQRDYRYYPEPDIPRIEMSREWVEDIRRSLPEFRRERAKRIQRMYALPELDVTILTEERELADLFEMTVALGGQPKRVSNWIMGELLRLMKEYNVPPRALKLSADHFFRLLCMLEDGRITQTTAKEIFGSMFRHGVDPEEFAAEHDLLVERDEELLTETVQRVLTENEKSVADYLSGKEKALGFLVGQAMKALGGKADPNRVRELLKRSL